MKEQLESKNTKINKLLSLLEKVPLEDSNFYADRALWHILTRWKDNLPELDHYFHRAFRQCDVTDDGNTDMVIWNLLNHSANFWRFFEMVQDEK